VVKKLAPGITGLEISLADFWGTSIYAREGEPYGQLVGVGYQRNSAGQILVNDDGLPMFTDERIPIGNFNPDWRGSWRNELSYGNVRMNFLLDTRQGGNVYSVSQLWGRYSGVLSETALGRCLPAGTIDALAGNGLETTYPACDASTGIIVDGVKIGSIAGGDTTFVKNDTPVSANDYYEWQYYIPEANVIDASYVKLREATLTFDLPSRLTRSMRIDGVQVSLIGRNLFLWTPSSNRHIDPETASDATNVQGYEYGQMPTPRSFGFSVSVRP
jgi:hypothetical protein